MNLAQLRDLLSVFIQRHSPEIDLPVELFNRLINAASISHFLRRLGLPEQYQPGTPIAAQVAEISTKVIMDLRPFIVHRNERSSPLAFSLGAVVYPIDFCYPLSASHVYVHTDGIHYTRNFDFTNEMQWSDRIGSVNKQPDVFFPIMRFTAQEINILPKTIQLVNFAYYKWPRAANMAMTLVNGINVYDPINSVQLEWDEGNMVDIAMIILANLGVVVNRDTIFQVAEKVKQQGI